MHLARSERRRVAVGAAYLGEGGTPIYRGRRVGRGLGGSQHAHEVGKRLDVRDDGRIGGARGRRCEVECVIGRGDIETARGLVALLGEQLVRDSHLDIVGFPREHDQGLVLGLPSEAGNGPIVGTQVGVAAQVRVGVSGDAQLRLCVCIGLHVREDRRSRGWLR